MTAPHTGIPGTSGAGKLITVSTGAATDTGLRRRTNEDSYLADGSLFFVADGMGGHDCGELASSLVISSFAALASQSSVGIEDLQRTMAQATERVAALPQETGRQPGTTLTGVAISDVGGVPYWLIINLGDSRTYRMADAVLEQISVDHSVVQEQVERGEMTPEEAGRSRRKNIVTRALGAGSDGEPDYWYIPAEPGDRMMICSDGLTNELDDSSILHILASEAAPQDAATRLVHEALLHGGRDNVTVLVVDAISVSGADPDFSTLPNAVSTRSLPEGLDDETIPRHELAMLRTPSEED